MMRPLQPRPAIYDEPSAFFGKGPIPSKDGPIVARFSRPWHLPSYTLSYLFSARVALEASYVEGVDSIALPALYMQRHAFELILKDLLDVCFSIEADRPWVREIRANGDLGPKRCQPNPPRLVSTTHKLKELTDELERTLKSLGYEPLPTIFGALVHRFDRLEKDDETRLRYSRIRGRELSLGETFVAPLSDLQNDLERLYQDHVKIDLETKDTNLNTELYVESDNLDRDLYHYGPDLALWPLELDAKDDAEAQKAIQRILTQYAYLEVMKHDDGRQRKQLFPERGKVQVLFHTKLEIVRTSRLGEAQPEKPAVEKPKS